MRVLAIVLGLALFWVGAAFAQEDSGAVDFEAWDRTASRAETALSEQAISDSVLADLRAQLADWRQRLLGAQGVNSTRIETLQTQLDALGPAPADGESEPDDVAARREDLTSELAEVSAPKVQAEAAFARADVLISQIDREIRDRQADAFFELIGTPLNPALWADAFAGLQETISDIGREVRRNLASETERALLRDRALPVLGMLFAALLFIIRGPTWFARLQERLARRSSPLGATVWGFVISLGEILLPVIGLSLLIGAIRTSGVLGATGTSLAVALNLAILAIAVGRWLARRLFPTSDAQSGPFDLEEGDTTEGRWLVRLLAFSLAVHLLVSGLANLETHSTELIAVLNFPVLILIGVALFRTGRLLRRSHAEGSGTEDKTFARQIVWMLGQFVQAVAVVGPFAAAVGYYNFGSGVLVPTVLSLAMMGVLLTLHMVLRSAWGLIRGLEVDELDGALVPILLTFALSLSALPLFALAWGARGTDLSEVWTQFLNGFTLGESRIRPGDFLTFVIVFALGFAATRLVQGALRTSVLPRTRLDKGGQSALVSGVGYIGLTLAAVIGITSAGIDLSSLAIVVGALGVGIGFGLQNIVNNFVSGIIMLIERPVSEGDWVEVNGQMGIVKAISVRSTRIETFDRTDVIVPNGDFISGTVTNWTRGNAIGRVTLSVGVAYGTDTRRVAEILQEIAEAHPMVALEPKPTVLFSNFGADSLEFLVHCILKDVLFKVIVHSDLNHSVHERFVEEGIEIPFAQRDIWLRNPEALRQGDAGSSVENAPPASAKPVPPRDEDGGEGETQD